MDDFDKTGKDIKADQEKDQSQDIYIKALLLILAIIAFRTIVGDIQQILFCGMMVSSPFVVFYIYSKAIIEGEGSLGVFRKYFTFIPSPYVDKADKLKDTPWVTYSLIFVNIFVFYIFTVPHNSELIKNNYICLPYKPTIFNVPFSFISSMFLHSGGFHLWGNMFFLWAFGTVVERRIGWKKFLLSYFICGIAAEFFSFYVYGFQMSWGWDYHSLGASGAISGIMGIYIIRCYFKTMAFPVPLLVFFWTYFPINIKIKMNSFVVIALFFISDVEAGINQVMGESFVSVGYWSHIGGMLCGMLIASQLKLFGAAIEESHLEKGTRILKDDFLDAEAVKAGFGFAEAEGSLRFILAKHPDNVEVILQLARIKSYARATDEGKEFYQRALSLIIATDSDLAVKVFLEYYKKYLENVNDAALQLRLSRLLYSKAYFEIAARTLERMIGDPTTPPDLKERAIFQCAMTFEKLDLPEAADSMYRRLIEAYPDSPGAEKAKMRLRV